MIPSLKKNLFILPLACLAGSLSLTQAAEGDVAAQMARGKTAYMTCAACHGMDGKGLPTTPPMAPTLIGSKLLNGPAEVPTAIILKGIQKMDQKYLGIMAPLGAAMTDAQIADVLTYVRGSFGNTAAPVAEADVKTWRDKYKDVTAPLPRTAYEKKSEKLAGEAGGAPAPAAGAAPAPAAGAAPAPAAGAAPAPAAGAAPATPAPAEPAK